MNYNNYNHQDYINYHKPIKLPTFKLGSYVIRPCNNQKDLQGFSRKILVTEKFLSDKLVQHMIDTYEQWTPQPNEWCWFMGGTMEYPVIRQLLHVADGMYYVRAHESFTSCKPFIGVLPSWCK